MSTTVTTVIDEPEQWAVLLVFDGEVLGNAHALYPSQPAAAARAAELRTRFPRHEVRIARRSVIWTEET